jgi:hypothetical protein
MPRERCEYRLVKRESGHWRLRLLWWLARLRRRLLLRLTRLRRLWLLRLRRLGLL